MNNLKFYIFGVPDGFDILSGTPEDIQYYQLFYDTSKKGKEMRINRKPNGETVYSYLIYNLVSSKGREGAFLGISLAFTGNEYCNNPAKLKELFAGVYEEVILKADDKDKIVMPLDGGNAVGRFCLSKFNDRKDFCDKIGRIIVNNVVGELANSITKIDGSFDNTKEGRVVTLPMNADAVSIVNALHGYMWVSLSSEIIPTPGPIHYVELLDRHYINELEKKKEVYKDSVIKGYEGKVSVNDVNAKIREVSGRLDIIEKYVGHQTELRKIRSEYSDIYNSLVGLRKKLDDEKGGGLGPGGGTPSSTPNPESMLTRIKRWIQENSKKVAGVLAVIVAIVFCVVFWPKDENKGSEPGEGGTDPIVENMPPFDKNKFNQLLRDTMFQEAWNMAQNEEQENTKKTYEGKVKISFNDWFIEQFESYKNNKAQLSELRSRVNECAFIDNKESYFSKIDNQITQLNKKTNNLPDPQPGDSPKTVEIYTANINYDPKSKCVVKNDHVIDCQMNDCFVIKNARDVKPSQSYNPENFGFAKRNDGTVRIKTIKIGTYKVQIDNVEYTFNCRP